MPKKVNVKNTEDEIENTRSPGNENGEEPLKPKKRPVPILGVLGDIVQRFIGLFK